MFLSNYLPRSVLTVMAIIASTQAASASPLLHGSWDCTTQFSRPEGDYRLQAIARVKKDGLFTSKGTVYAYNALINTEIPLAFTAHGAWQAKGEKITSEIKEGNISTGISFLDKIADILEEEVRKTPLFATKIKTLDRKKLVLSDGNHHPVECTRQEVIATKLDS